MYFAHLPASYLLTEAAQAIGFALKPKEIILISLVGIMPDFDLAVAYVLKRYHHRLASHTPFGLFLLWLAFFLVFGHYFSLTANLLVLVAFLLHLFLDDFASWFSKKIYKESYCPREINWLYPFRRFAKEEYIISYPFKGEKERRINNRELENYPFFYYFLAAKDYFIERPASFMLEIFITLTAIAAFSATR